MIKQVIEINEVRIKLDQLGDHLISLLKHRSCYQHNQGVFSELFADNMTWFMYRLKKEQDIDAEFGRFVYPDQHPLIFRKSDLATPKIPREAPVLDGLHVISINISEKLLAIYQRTLACICTPGEDLDTYGQTVKLDVEILLTLNERISGLGNQVAEYKIKTNPALATTSDKSQIRKFLTVPEREQQVIDQAIATATRLAIRNPEAIGDFMREIIQVTLDVEVEYICAVRG